MKKLILYLLFLSTIVLAQNPSIYSNLGNVIYDNASKIQKLKNLSNYNKYSQKIDDYLAEVEKIKKFGFYVEEAKDKTKNKLYLNNLRRLSKTNDFFVRSVKKNFEDSLEKQDSNLFYRMINSGLLDIDEYKQEIKEYYFSHEDEVNTAGVIETYFAKDIEKKKKKKKSKKYKKLTKKQLQAAKIKRIRQRDKQKQEAIKKSLEKELRDKKIKILQDQKRELGN